MVPNDELVHLVLVISEAFAVAAQGRVPRGYMLLRDGLFQARRSDAPYAKEFAILWQRSLERYKEEFPSEWFGEDHQAQAHLLVNHSERPSQDHYQ